MRFLPAMLTILSVGFSAQICAAQSVQLMTPQIKQQLTAYYDALETADTQKALDALNALIRSDPSYANYYGARASVMEVIPGSSPDSILADLNRAIQLDSSLLQWVSKRAAFCLDRGTDKLKVRAMKDLLSLCQRDSITLSYRLDLLPILINMDSMQSSAIYQEALKIAYQQVTEAPGQAESWFALARVYCNIPAPMEEEDIRLALGYLNKALNLDPARWEYAKLRAELYANELHNLDAAIEDYKYVITLAPTPSAYESLALLYAASGQKQQAVTTVKDGLVLFPGSYALDALKRKLR